VYSKIRLCERLNVRFAPKATELLRGSEMTRCANSDITAQRNPWLFDHPIGAGEYFRLLGNRKNSYLLR